MPKSHYASDRTRRSSSSSSNRARSTSRTHSQTSVDESYQRNLTEHLRSTSRSQASRHSSSKGHTSTSTATSTSTSNPQVSPPPPVHSQQLHDAGIQTARVQTLQSERDHLDNLMTHMKESYSRELHAFHEEKKQLQQQCASSDSELCSTLLKLVKAQEEIKHLTKLIESKNQENINLRNKLEHMNVVSSTVDTPVKKHPEIAGPTADLQKSDSDVEPPLDFGNNQDFLRLKADVNTITDELDSTKFQVTKDCKKSIKHLDFPVSYRVENSNRIIGARSVDLIDSKQKDALLGKLLELEGLKDYISEQTGVVGWRLRTGFRWKEDVIDAVMFSDSKDEIQSFSDSLTVGKYYLLKSYRVQIPKFPRGYVTNFNYGIVLHLKGIVLELPVAERYLDATIGSADAKLLTKKLGQPKPGKAKKPYKDMSLHGKKLSLAEDQSTLDGFVHQGPRKTPNPPGSPRPSRPTPDLSCSLNSSTMSPSLNITINSPGNSIVVQTPERIMKESLVSNENLQAPKDTTPRRSKDESPGTSL